METPINEDPNLEMNSEKKVKYPFSGVAPNLIDKFLVLGYDQKVIDYTFKYLKRSDDLKPDLKTRFDFFDFDERPSIINEICNDYTKDLLENDLILELIFPNIPEMYFLDIKHNSSKKEIDEELLISTYSIIFSINPQDNSGSKKSYNGLGYIFYVPMEHKTDDKIDGTVYVPIAYVILSEYPYFYHFKEICKHVLRQMKQEHDGIPIEILLYNVVKYLQSPINKSINLTFVAPLGLPFKDKGNNLSDILYPLYSLSQDDNRIPSMFFHQLSGYPFMDINLSFLFNLIPPEIVVEVFIFSFLEHDIIFYSSRPEILNMVMYIFSNLNYPFNDSIYYWHVLSVSQDNFMNGTSTFVGKTCSTLTGILSEYDPDVLTTSKIREHFVLDIDNKNFFFLFQEETEDVKDTINLYTYIKNCAQEADENNNEAIRIDKEARVKNYYNDGIQLFEVIKNLMEELNRRSKKVTSTNYNEKTVKPSFLTLYEDESEMECIEANLRLQKAFFTFIAQISQNFVGILFIEGEKNQDDDFNLNLSVNIKKDDTVNEEEENKRKLAPKAGRIFRKKFMDCSKYSSFVINFCKYHDTIDLYKIPYTFINEFIYYSHVAVRNNLSEVDVFKLIDQFYGKRKIVSFEEIIKNNGGKEGKDKKEKKKEKDKAEKKNKESEKESLVEEVDIRNIYAFNFINFVEYYKENLRALINREQEDDKEIFTKMNTRQFKTYKRNGFYLSNKLLNIYMNICNNNIETFVKLFQLIKCEKISDPNVNKINSNQIININEINEGNDDKNNLEEILMNKNMNKLEKDLKIFGSYEFVDITDVIERHFIIERCFTSYGLVKFSLLNILAITRGFENQKISNPKVMETVCDFCNMTKSLARKYMNIFLNIFQELNFNHIIKNKKEFLKCLHIIKKYFEKSNMLPTEETTKAINNFNEKQKGEAGVPITESKEDINLIESSDSKDEKEEELMRQYINDNGKFFDEKSKKKKFDEMMKTIEAIFTGNYSTKTGINSITYKELSTAYSKHGVKDKDKILPKTPLNLYYSSNELLKKYINNNFRNKKEDYDVILFDILSLLFYFKIPVIGEKWVEHYKSEREKLKLNTMKSIKDKNSKKKETKNAKVEEESQESKGLKEPISIIIAILVNLVDVIQKDFKNLN